MSKKVLLVHPEISRTKYNFSGVIENEPLELEYIVPVLDGAGYDVEIFDKAIEKRDLKQFIASLAPDYLYVCGRTRQEDYMKEYCRWAKEKGAITIVGGIHAQHNYNRFFVDEVDFILHSFDIFKLLDIFDFAEKKRDCLSDVTGVCYRDQGNWHTNKAEPFDINRLPLPDRRYLYKHLDSYRYLELLPCAHVRTAYSCVYNCSFCYRTRLNRGRYSHRPIEEVVAEIEGLEVDNIYFIDDDFLIDPNRIRRFTQLIKERGIKKSYVAYGRVDFIIENKDLMQELKDIGFYYILVGMESIKNSDLESYNKNIKVQDTAECIRFANGIGINLMGMFIVDLDFEPRDFTALYRWIKKSRLKHAALSLFLPEMGSDTYLEYQDRLISSNPEHWDYLHIVARPKYMGVKQFYFRYYKLMIRLFLLTKKNGVYDFIDHNYYLKSFVKNMFNKTD